MTTATQPITLAPLGVDPALLDQVAATASAVDKGEVDARYILPLLGDAGLLDADLLTTARLIRELSRNDLSVGFTTWAHRMTLEYLRAADAEDAQTLAKQLEAGERPGVTGMAAAFKEFAGCGDIELTATRISHRQIKRYVSLARTDFSDEELASYERQGRQAILRSIPQMNLLEQARTNAAKVIIPMILQMGYREEDITVSFRKRFTPSDLPTLLHLPNDEKTSTDE